MAVQSSSVVELVAFAITAVLLTVTTTAQAPNQAAYLAAHNAARSAVGVKPLTWNHSVYLTASFWAASCFNLHNPGRGELGENLAYGVGLTATAAVDRWVAEKADYNHASDTCTEPVNQCLHYTQVVWNTTTQVGCASGICAMDSATPTYFHVCNYYPPGNYPGVPPY